MTLRILSAKSFHYTPRGAGGQEGRDGFVQRRYVHNDRSEYARVWQRHDQDGAKSAQDGRECEDKYDLVQITRNPNRPVNVIADNEEERIGEEDYLAENSSTDDGNGVQHSFYPPLLAQWDRHK